ncbi:hypothetical protein SAMN05444008_12230 [Cnuella takakiae]|uniref:Lipoprotein n=1 Tax=Cnuella takakiae TaxID=1302690 RepID=A0A1M5I8J0_9BACT|nr:hypothetical protein [Cnuella takakiae]OLY93200.1 hypothetical protein BUE76_15875 [Cnuella takakiae]SHG24113.1 hypothetical protein SAMN05444008_12230 [Cnuella takakiae]
MRNTIIGFLLLLTVACNKADLSLPEGIRKLVQDKDCSSQPYMDLYRWQGQQVFVLKMKGPA